MTPRMFKVWRFFDFISRERSLMVIRVYLILMKTLQNQTNYRQEEPGLERYTNNAP